MRHNWAPFSSFHQRQPQQYPTNLSNRFTYLHASFSLLLGTNSERPCVCPTLRLKHICGCDSKWLGPANWVSLPSFTNQPSKEEQRLAALHGSLHLPTHPSTRKSRSSSMHRCCSANSLAAACFGCGGLQPAVIPCHKTANHCLTSIVAFHSPPPSIFSYVHFHVLSRAVAP
jgi:hypothetical protein